MQETQEMQVRSLGREDPWKKKWQPTPVFLSKKFYGQRGLAGYSPWGCRESDMTKQLSTHKTKKKMKKYLCPGSVSK